MKTAELTVSGSFFVVTIHLKSIFILSHSPLEFFKYTEMFDILNITQAFTTFNF